MVDTILTDAQVVVTAVLYWQKYQSLFIVFSNGLAVAITVPFWYISNGSGNNLLIFHHWILQYFIYTNRFYRSTWWFTSCVFRQYFTGFFYWLCSCTKVFYWFTSSAYYSVLQIHHHWLLQYFTNNLAVFISCKAKHYLCITQCICIVLSYLSVALHKYI